MSPAAPKLDKRSAADVLAQARALAKAPYLGELWKGRDDPSEPAYQLMKLFARLMEILIGRLNQVPDKNFLAFLDMVGVEASPGAPATVPVTFLPSAKAPEGGLIPKGTQVATTQTDQIDAQIFETRFSFYATASKLVAALNLLPDADLFSTVPVPVLPPKPANGKVSAPETVLLTRQAMGLEEVPHVLYLGKGALFGRKETLDITLVLTVASGDASLLNDTHLRWKRFDKDQKTWVDVAASYSVEAGKVTVVLQSFGNNEKTALAGQEDFWAACHFVGPLTPGAPRIASIEGGLSPAGSASGVTAAPQKAFANDFPVDLSRPFRPYGERPRYGDALYLMSLKAFAPEVDEVTVTFQLKGYTLAELQAIFSNINADTQVVTLVSWQYLAADGTWKPITEFKHTLSVVKGTTPSITHELQRGGTVTTTEDGTFFGQAYSKEASFSFPRPADMGLLKVHGEEGFWIRALLKSDDPYGKEAFVVPSEDPELPPKVVGPTLMPPVVESAQLSFDYKGELQGIDRVVTENNFARVDHRQGGSAPLFPIQPFVPLNAMPLEEGAGLAFAGGPALYLGFDQPFGDRYISLYLKLRENFPSVDSPAEQGEPVVAWEYLTDSLAWKPLDVDDETAHLTGSGTVSFLGPSDSAALALFAAAPGALARKLYWYRARLTSGRYDHPPVLQGLYPNTVLADNRYTFRKEVVLGSGSGQAHQRLLLPKSPVLAGELWVREAEPPSELEVQALEAEHRLPSSFAPDDGLPLAPVVEIRTAAAREVWVRWRRVPNFLGSGPRSRHYTLNPLNGELRLGDGVTGMLPPIAKDNLVFRDYQTGGGEAAVRAAIPLAVKELKSSLPYVERVFNVEPATGGSNPWTLEDIFVFGPQSVKNKGRAVSAEDFEWMVLQRFSQVARARCLSTQAPGPTGLVFKPGAVTLIVVPKGSERIPRPSSSLLATIRDYLARQCLGSIISDVHVLGPGFKEVTIRARVRAVDPRESSEVERRALRALEDFFHPLYGGESGRGWDFGRDVQLSEVFAVLQRVEGVDYVEDAEFVDAPDATSLDIGGNALVHSGTHLIEMI